MINVAIADIMIHHVYALQMSRTRVQKILVSKNSNFVTPDQTAVKASFTRYCQFEGFTENILFT